jgi:hypothetical protein
MLGSTLAGPMVLAGAVAIGATVAVERFGARTGGLLATLPTTVVPAGWGMYAGADDLAAFGDAMGAVPVGMLVNASFLWTWRALPPRLPEGSLAVRLAAMGIASMTVWAGLAAMATLALAQVRAMGMSVPTVGAFAFAFAVAVGVWAAQGAPRGASARTHVPLPALLARGGMAALAIGVATGLAGSGAPLLAGMASVFPAIFLTTMVALWWSHGDAVPSGAVGPMMLGSAAVSAYALVAVWSLPALGVVLGSLVAWGVAVGLVTLPAWGWLRR